MSLSIPRARHEALDFRRTRARRTLVDKGGDRFSGEVIRTLLTEVENHRTGLLVVLTGYADKMEAGQCSDLSPGE